MTRSNGYDNRCAQYKFEGHILFILLRLESGKAVQGKRHGDHQDRQPRAIRNGVHRMQRLTGRTEVVGVREQTRSPSFLVL